MKNLIWVHVHCEWCVQVKLDSIEHMDLVTRRGQLTIKLLVHGDGAKLLLRGAPEDTRHWFNMIMGCCNQVSPTQLHATPIHRIFSLV